MKNILIYTGHCEIVGGDAKFILETVKYIDAARFNVHIITDSNRAFEVALQQYLTGFAVEFIDTRPVLNKVGAFEALISCLRKKNDINIVQFMLKVLLSETKGRPLYKYIRYMANKITFKQTRDLLWNFRIFKRYFKLNGKKFDVFHFNNGGYPAKKAGLIAICIAKYYKIKTIILSIHNVPEKRRLFDFFRYFFDFSVPRICDSVTVPSLCVKESLTKLSSKFSAITHLVYCGIESKSTLIDKQCYEKNIFPETNLNRFPMLLLVGNYDEDRKGHLVAISAIQDIVKLYPKLMLVFVGGGNDRRKQMIMNYAALHNLESNIYFLGHRHDIHELNLCADVILVPSTGFEATPYTIKEASRAGKPVVTTTAGGCAEGVINNVTGLIVRPGNAEDLSEAILELINSTELRMKMGAAARIFFEDNFLITKQIATIEKLYNI